MQMTGRVFLDDEAQRFRRHDFGILSRRLGRFGKVPHRLIGQELLCHYVSSQCITNISTHRARLALAASSFPDAAFLATSPGFRLRLSAAIKSITLVSL